jgi:hypothetical protein
MTWIKPKKHKCPSNISKNLNNTRLIFKTGRKSTMFRRKILKNQRRSPRMTLMMRKRNLSNLKGPRLKRKSKQALKAKTSKRSKEI